ncbi:MAG: DNA-binding response regulator [Gallionellales bacterium RIFCSPLOWO2_02_FULL_57_47]|jgi:two-component system invasion response regulator UvrY|nr:MAG: DNA-binding response regulator [Gallionellales bacterium RIFCSPLOWO2_02_FULL_57_47]OGT08405.1 MAG: DNA-binding response regulator [Gallionellales bacterium RIFCSPHIGHO2_02_FULL_57_16]
MIRILITDDHAIVRQGLARILEKDQGMEIVAEYDNGIDALHWLRANDCDIALIDISMPGMSGIDLLKQIREEKPKLPVLVISIYPEDQYAVRLIKAGAAGYLTKGCAPAIVVEAVHQIVSGKKYISPVVAEMLANECGTQDGKLPHETLSDREYQIFLLLASAKTVSEIADTLALSGKTISTYRSRILEKMHLRNNAEIMHYAIEKQIQA